MLVSYEEFKQLVDPVAVMTAQQNKLICAMSDMSTRLVAGSDHSTKKRLVMLREVLLEMTRECAEKGCRTVWLDGVYNDDVSEIIIKMIEHSVYDHPEWYLTESMLQEHYEFCVHIAQRVSLILLERHAEYKLKALQKANEICSDDYQG